MIYLTGWHLVSTFFHASPLYCMEVFCFCPAGFKQGSGTGEGELAVFVSDIIFSYASTLFLTIVITKQNDVNGSTCTSEVKK